MIKNSKKDFDLVFYIANQVIALNELDYALKLLNLAKEIDGNN